MTAAVHRDSPGRYLAVGAGILVVAFLAWKLLPVDDWIEWMVTTISSMGVTGMVLFCIIYVVGACIGFPRTPLNVGAGVMFSYPVALALVLISGTTVFMMTFQISRNYARDWVLNRLKNIPNADTVMKAVEEEGFKLVVLLRMNPFLPGIIKGYGFGTTTLPFKTYLAGSIVGFIPIAAAYVYLGWLGGEAMMDSASQPKEWRNAVLIGGAIVSVLMIVLVSWFGHRAMEKKSANKQVHK